MRPWHYIKPGQYNKETNFHNLTDPKAWNITSNQGYCRVVNLWFYFNNRDRTYRALVRLTILV